MKALIGTVAMLVQKADKHKEKRTQREKKRADKAYKKEKSNQELQRCQLEEKEQRAKAASIDAAIQKLFAEKQRVLGALPTLGSKRAVTPSHSQGRESGRSGGLQDSLPSAASCSIGSGFTTSNTVQLFSTDIWEPIVEAPPCTTNAKAQPIGAFWEYLKTFAVAKAARTFDWRKPWNQQNNELKTRFKLRLHQFFPGTWDDHNLMRHVGERMKDRRTRVRKAQRKWTDKEKMIVPVGCSQAAWDGIYEDMFDEKKSQKSQLCREAALKRFANGGCSHRWGRRGMAGTATIFVRFQLDYRFKMTNCDVLI